MGPADLLALVSIIQSAIAAAPQLVSLVTSAKAFIAELFGAGVITKAQQDQLHAHVDAICSAVLTGKEPPEFQVEADPA
jgi:hypothetical protein